LIFQYGIDEDQRKWMQYRGFVRGFVAMAFHRYAGSKMAFFQAWSQYVSNKGKASCKAPRSNERRAPATNMMGRLEEWEMEEAAPFKWALLADDAVAGGHTGLAEEFIMLAYQCHDDVRPHGGEVLHREDELGV
jgi:hypothetical protein